MENKIMKFLKSFNRKERFHLLNQAVAGGLKLDKEIAKEIDEVLSLGSLLRDNHDNSDLCFIAMDYHIDWLYAALFLASLNDMDSETILGQIYHRECIEELDGKPIIQANQEDIDLLIGVESEGVVHLIMIEAKGDTAWSTSQMKSKIKRLKAIFGNAGENFDQVKPYYLLLSPGEPQKLKITLPEWMRSKDVDHGFFWVRLTMSGEKEFWKIQRTKDGSSPYSCPEDGYPNWKIRRVKIPKQEA